MRLYKKILVESIYKIFNGVIEKIKSYYQNISNDKFNNIIKLDSTYQGGNQYKEFELSNRQKKQQIRNDAELFYEDDNWKVIIPKIEEASCLYGANTKWCTMGKEDNMFNEYNSRGSLYIFINKKDNEKYQLHFESNQFMNKLNQRVSKIEFFDNLPKQLIQKFQSQFIKNISINPLWIKYIINPSEEIQLEAVKDDGFAMNYIKNPSKKVQMEAVKHDGYIICYIKNPSEDVQIEAVKQNERAIEFIQNPSERVQIESVKKWGYSIQYINNPSEKLQIEAVKQNGLLIEYIINPIEDVQLEAVKQNGLAIQYLINPSEKVKIEAVKQDGYSIIYIKDPSAEVQIEAVKKDIGAIRFIKNPVEKVKEYVKKHS